MKNKIFSKINTYNFIATLLIYMLFLILFNCSNDYFNREGNEADKISEKKYGAIKININGSRTILPDFIAPLYYDITGDGPDNSTFSINNVMGSSKLITDLVVGEWNISVSGKDASGCIIVKGSSTANIIKDQTTDVYIDVNYYQASFGAVDLTVDWDASIFVDSAILQINNDSTIDIYISGNSVNYKNNSIISGSHSFIFNLKKNGIVIASIVESVHIYDNLTTEKVITVPLTDFNKPPAAPTGLSAVEGPGKIIISWNNQFKTETGYIVERSVTSGSGFTVIGNTDLSLVYATSYINNKIYFDDETALYGVTYYYRIKAKNYFGSSDYSDEANAKIEHPKILYITPSDGSVVHLSTDIKIVFSVGLDAGVKGKINFASPSILFEDTTNCAITFITTNVTDDTIIINPNSFFNDNVSYSDITVTEFKDKYGKTMLTYNDNDYSFTADSGPIINIIKNGGPFNIELTTDVNITNEYALKIGYPKYQWTQSSEFPTEGIWTTFNSGDVISLSSIDGEYYLHIWALDINDIESKISSNKYILDNTKPKIGSAIWFSNTTTNSFTVNWGEATDDNGPLTYKLYYSTTDNLWTINDCETKGIVAMDWSTNTSFNLTGLEEKKSYYFNVIVKDVAGNMTCYDMKQGDTDSTVLNIGKYGIGTDGVINSMVQKDGILYIGGMFKNVGRKTSGALLDMSSDNENINFPAVNGNVYAVISDGSGGWIIGGAFTKVGEYERNRIAWINSDGSVRDWNPNASYGSFDCYVSALAISGSTVYVGGLFITIGGQTRCCIAAIDITTGLATSWNSNASGTVRTLAISGSNVYAGGEFTTIGGQSRNNIAAIDVTTGLASDWNPGANGVVYTLAISGSNVYAGGDFTTIGGQSRNYIAAIDIATGLATDWNPNASWYVKTLTLSGSTVYVGGTFTTIGGQTRNNIAAVDITTGLATDWNPNASSSVSSLTISGSAVYAGGYFTTIGGQNRNSIAAIDITTGLATDWNPNANYDVSALAISGSAIYAGGKFTTISGQSRNNIAAIDITTGLATDWNPNVDGDTNNNVSVLAVSGGNVYAGGFFTSIGGQSRNNIAAIDITTGLATSWNPNANYGVSSLTISGSNVYAGGSFTSIGGQSRNRIAAIDVTTGLATGWNPSANGVVYALAISGSNVYAGGFFTSIGGQSRNNIAAIDLDTGLPITWNPNASNRVSALVVSGSTLYVGGSFTTIDGKIRNRIAAIDLDTGHATIWGPSANDPVTKLVVSGINLYAGGYFTTISGQTRNRIAAIDITTGFATSWNPDADNYVNSLIISGSVVYVGGNFSSIGGESRNRLAAIDFATGEVK
ncbi:MAG: Ig-like domain-containing protein [Spirochaetes bacterium]|nr:Ig-like domain-containing protein [Spirochaetota bacterium]